MHEQSSATFRRKQEEAVEHETRRAILELLAGGRELPSTAIQQELSNGISLSCLVYHLKVLQDAALVERADDGRAAGVFGLAA